MPGQPITFSLTLNKVYPDVQLDLQCTGTIVRVEQHRGRRGIAATIDSWSFEPSKHASAGQQGQSVSG